MVTGLGCGALTLRNVDRLVVELLLLLLSRDTFCGSVGGGTTVGMGSNPNSVANV
jgi:hypothetical protein